VTLQRKRIAILGGGISSLAAAFDLSSESDWQSKYEITVYQMGWRLGGKGASSRNPERGDRIEEHGLHIWIGFYENAFSMMRQCYKEIGSRPGTLPSWDCAFKPHSFLVLEERVGDGWMHWPISVPTNDSLPGDGQELPTLWDYLVMAVQWIREWLEPRQLVPTKDMQSASVSTRSHEVMVKELSTKERLNPRLGLKLIRAADRHAKRMPRDARKHTSEERAALLSLLRDFSSLLSETVPPGIEKDAELRRTWVTIDLFAAVVRGALANDVLGKGLDQLDVLDFRDWLQEHGAANITINSALIRAAYDLAFSFENGDPSKMNLAAGVALRALFRMVFTYKGAFLWKMQAGMGETVFTPLYRVLRGRGVKFEFFHYVEALKTSEDGKLIDEIRVWRQAHCKNPEYEPLVRVNNLDCWHYGPDFSQLEEGEELKASSSNLESYWTTWNGGDRVTFERGKHFDTIILGIPIEGLKGICGDIIRKSERWQAMAERVKTIQTQGFQLWLMKDLSQCGWTLDSPILGAYVEPLDTWADMSHLLAVENWPAESQPRQIAYFCGVMETADQLASKEDLQFPLVEASRCKKKAIDFLKRDSCYLWPKAGQASLPDTFDWGFLASNTADSEVNRFDSQYWRANVDPSERYVLALAGTTEYRLRTDESGFSNLLLTGDWIRNGFNSPGCIESAVISGRQAARAISSTKARIIGENDLTLRHGILDWIALQIKNVADMFYLSIDKWKC